MRRIQESHQSKHYLWSGGLKQNALRLLSVEEIISSPKSNLCPSWQSKEYFGSETAASGGCLASAALDCSKSAPCCRMYRYFWVP